MTILVVVYGFIIGAVIASFLGVVSERVPKKESINGRSHCQCGRQLKASENIPLIGWLLNRETKCCQSKLPARYFWSELYLAGLYAFIGFWWSNGSIGIWLAIVYMVAGAAALTWFNWDNGKDGVENGES